MTDDPPRRGLAKGLSALLGDGGDEPFAAGGDAIQLVPTDSLRPSPFQPRRRFDEAALLALADSIRASGLLQPILVRRDAREVNRYQIVAGERRWRAAQLAQLHDVPVMVKVLSDRDTLAIALVENLQRENLTALEEAEAYRRLMEEFQFGQAEVAQAVGKSRSHIANTVRLLTLPDLVKEMLDEGELTPGHARALLAAPDPAALAREAVARGLNVRQVERLVQRPARTAGAKGAQPRDPNTVALEHDVSARLGLKVTIEDRGGHGRLVVAYGNLEQLDDVVRRLSRPGAPGD
ncbi:MAG: ParB/RepB/Spo0J family partition protein [Alphaproteobacteria bacterium]|nr:ParB/RepB/Spo0J family partition protein [Alphaproteobacteria bacterium]